MDNKPAVQQLKRRIPDVASPRILQWLVQLGGYDFSVLHREGKRHANADLLSRLPDPTHPVPESKDNIDEEIAGTVFSISGAGEAEIPLTSMLRVIECHTKRDPVLTQDMAWTRLR